MEQIFEIITSYGLETVIISLLINVLTGVIKSPIKKIASKFANPTKITRFIVFMPIALGFAVTFLYEEFVLNSFDFNKEFITLWLTSSSLSLTFYAIFEKFFPSRKKLLSDSEIKTSETILENIKELFKCSIDKESKLSIEEMIAVDGQKDIKNENKIILKKEK